jgi:hypothetical protein
MVAIQRAAHQLLESPLVLDDPLALTILGEPPGAATAAWKPGTRSSIARCPSWPGSVDDERPLLV